MAGYCNVEGGDGGFVFLGFEKKSLNTLSQGDCPRVSLFGKLFLFVIMKSCPKREKSCKEKGNTVYYT
jgi:hypothetical protein